MKSSTNFIDDLVVFLNVLIILDTVLFDEVINLITVRCLGVVTLRLRVSVTGSVGNALRIRRHSCDAISGVTLRLGLLSSLFTVRLFAM